MPSTDIDGSTIVILSTDEAQAVMDLLRWTRQETDTPLNDDLQRVAVKIARDLNLKPLT